MRVRGSERCEDKKSISRFSKLPSGGNRPPSKIFLENSNQTRRRASGPIPFTHCYARRYDCFRGSFFFLLLFHSFRYFLHPVLLQVNAIFIEEWSQQTAKKPEKETEMLNLAFLENFDDKEISLKYKKKYLLFSILLISSNTLCHWF